MAMAFRPSTPHQWFPEDDPFGSRRYMQPDEPTIKPELLSTPVKEQQDADVFCAMPSRETTAQPFKRPKGRSLGENSSKPIKEARKAAQNGDIDAALKLGWSKDRLTELFNRNKLQCGFPARLDDEIDDPDLLERIEVRNRNAKEAQRRRADKLKVQALAGDIEAAKKLGYSKKRLQENFPDLFPADPRDEEQSKKEVQAAIQLGFSNEKIHELFPRLRGGSSDSSQLSTPHDFENAPIHEENEPFGNAFSSMFQQKPVLPPISQMMKHPSNRGDVSPMLAFQVVDGPPSYPMPPTSFAQMESMLQRELEQARYEMSAAKQKQEKVQNRLAALRNFRGVRGRPGAEKVEGRRGKRVDRAVQSNIIRLPIKKRRGNNSASSQPKKEADSGSVDSAIEVE